MKVLVVSSSEETREALRGPLLPAGLQLSFAQSSHEAMELLVGDAPDAVLMDAQRSAMEGLSLLKRIRQSAPQQHVPVLLLVAPEDRAERLLALRLGADDVLQAPWDDEELLARVQRSLALKRRVDALVAEGLKLEHLSITDGLTEVNNHRFFRERLAQEFQRAERYRDPLTLLLVDLDHFKDVNDLYGHLVGDAVLKSVAQSIRLGLRGSDFLARYGGEEFAVILPKTDPALSLAAAQRICRDIRALRFAGEPALHITASVGSAGFPRADVQTPEALIAAADGALYAAKRSGRNKVCLSQVKPDAASQRLGPTS